jgi:hypothetical protein
MDTQTCGYNISWEVLRAAKNLYNATHFLGAILLGGQSDLSQWQHIRPLVGMLISDADLVRCSERERRSGIQEALEDPTSVWG